MVDVNLDERCEHLSCPKCGTEGWNNSDHPRELRIEGPFEYVESREGKKRALAYGVPVVCEQCGGKAVRAWRDRPRPWEGA